MHPTYCNMYVNMHTSIMFNQNMPTGPSPIPYVNMHTSIMFDRACLPDRAPLGQHIHVKTSSACSGSNDREWPHPSTRATLQPLLAKPTGSAGFANSGRVRFSEMHRGRNMRSTKASRSHVRKRRGWQNLAACHEHRAAQVPPPRL